MKVFLIGPMGTGKSSTGKDLSRELGLSFQDTDKLVESSENKSISEIFEINNEEYFRQKEMEALIEASKLENVVVATGGGIVEKEDNRDILEREKNVIFLDSSIERQFEKTKDSNKRPLLNDANKIDILRKLYEKRRLFYENTSDLKISMDGLEKSEVIKKIINFLKYNENN
ncbi:MAG: shikimate kinase [Gammaproteobacteria bacterium]|jgi:shikimate kinase|tara:strand:- start:1239 stop:1754 length:516 start_codon:yes stop_codon:yes gene_type:complete